MTEEGPHQSSIAPVVGGGREDEAVGPHVLRVSPIPYRHLTLSPFLNKVLLSSPVLPRIPYVVQAGLELSILLLQCPEGWDNRGALARPACIQILLKALSIP